MRDGCGQMLPWKSNAMIRTENTFEHPISDKSLAEFEEEQARKKKAFMAKYRAYEEAAHKLCHGDKNIKIGQVTFHIHPNSGLPTKMTFTGTVKAD